MALCHTFFVLLAYTLVVPGPVESFYLPLQTLTDYCSEDIEEPHQDNSTKKCQSRFYVHVNKLDSVETLISYDYNSFDFCPASSDTLNNLIENLGQFVTGDKLRTSGYEFKFAMNSYRKVLCTRFYDPTKIDDVNRLKFLHDRIHQDYMHHWIIDDMPVTLCYTTMKSNDLHCNMKLPIGCYVTKDGVRHGACYISHNYNERGATYIFNHVQFVISYLSSSKESGYASGHLVRAEVLLVSCQPPCNKASKPMKIPTNLTEVLSIEYSYSVNFVENNDIAWAHRWDYVLSSSSMDKIQFVSFYNSSFIALVVLVAIAAVIRRMTKVDNLQKKMKSNNIDGIPQDGRWLLVCDDVFRPPKAIMLLSSSVGSGMQLLIMSLMVLLLGCLGFLPPLNRGALVTSMLVISLLLSLVAGHVSTVLYKIMGGLHWKNNVLMTGLFVPGIILIIIIFLNLLHWSEGSSAAIPFTTLLAVSSMWFGISLPLMFLGSFLGLKWPALKLPQTTNNTPRKIPQKTCSSFAAVNLGIIIGILPFSTIFIQLFKVFPSIWSGQTYYMFGIITINYVVMLFHCAIVSILMSCVLLYYEDYRWWWWSLVSSGNIAFYLFFFSIYFIVYKTTITGVISFLMYFSYIFIFAIFFFFTTGSIGFLSSLLFVKKIYKKACRDKLLNQLLK